MQIEYRLSLKDYQEANQVHLKLQRWFHLLFWFFMIIGLFFLLLPFIVGSQLDLFIVIYFIFFALILFNPYFNNPLKNYFIGRAWKGLSNFHHPITTDIDEDKLKMITINCESSVQWQFYIQAIETKNLFLLYQAKALFNIIPKRAFSSDDQVTEFRELLRAKIAKFQKV